MFALHTGQSSPNTYTPNILPCRIHHDGPVDLSTRYWQPTKDDNGTKRSIPQTDSKIH